MNLRYVWKMYERLVQILSGMPGKNDTMAYQWEKLVFHTETHV